MEKLKRKLLNLAKDELINIDKEVEKQNNETIKNINDILDNSYHYIQDYSRLIKLYYKHNSIHEDIENKIISINKLLHDNTTEIQTEFIKRSFEEINKLKQILDIHNDVDNLECYNEINE